MESSSNEQLVVYRSKIILICFSVISILVSLAVLFATTNNSAEALNGSTQINSAGMIILVLCFIAFVWSIYRIFKNNPILIVNSQFLYIPKFGNISWNEIEKVGIKSSSVIPDKYAESIYIMSVPIIFVYLKDGRSHRLSRSFYSIDPINVIKAIAQFHEVVYLKDGSKFITSNK